MFDAQSIDNIRSNRDYKSLNSLKQTFPSNIFGSYLQLELSIFSKIQSETYLKDCLSLIEEFENNNSALENNFIDHFCLHGYLLSTYGPPEYQKAFYSTLSDLPNISLIVSNSYYENLDSQIFRSFCILELYLKRLFYLNELNRGQEMENWLELLVKTYKKLKQNNSYFFLIKISRDLLMLWISKRLSIGPKTGEIFEILLEILNLYSKKELIEPMKLDVQLLLIYTLCKESLSGIIRHSKSNYEINKIKESIKNFIENYREYNLTKFNLHHITNFNDLFILFFAIGFHLLINKTSKLTIRKDNIPKKENIEPKFLSIDLSSTKKQVRERIKSIIGLKISSLTQTYSRIIGCNEFSSIFMRNFFETPFDSESFSMKLCVDLFNNDELLKCQSLIRLVLESESLQRSRFFPIILHLSVYIYGKIVSQPQDALLYGKLNVSCYMKILRKDYPIRLDSLYGNLGFCFYELAKQSIYIAEKALYLEKACEYFGMSSKLCLENYLIAHYTAKVFLMSYNVELALSYAKRAVTLNRDHLESFLLLALILSAKDELKKSNSILEELILENRENSVLYLLKAFIETEYIVENMDKTEELTDQLKGIKERPEIEAILEKIQLALALSLGDNSKIKFNPRFFDELPKLRKLHEATFSCEKYLAYKHTLLYSLDILLHLGLMDLFSKLIEIFRDSKSDEVYLYHYLGVLAKKEGKYQEALSNFELSLNKDPFFLQSLIRKGDVYINLGLYDKAKETFIKALQFEESGEILYGIGQCYLKEGNITEGNNFLIKALDKNNKEPIISVNIIKECHFEYN